MISPLRNGVKARLSVINVMLMRVELHMSSRPGAKRFSFVGSNKGEGGFIGWGKLGASVTDVGAVGSTGNLASLTG